MTLGPVQLMAITFDEPRFDGSLADEVNRLSEAGVVRLLDAVFVQKDENGVVTTAAVTELEADEMIELGATIGGLLGLGAHGEAGMEVGAALGAAETAQDGHVIGKIGVVDVLDQVEPGKAAGVVLLEHLWAIPLIEKIGAAGGELVVDALFSPETLVALGATLAEG